MPVSVWAAPAAPIRLAGSDLARPAIAPLVVGFNRDARRSLELVLDGSRQALADLGAGKADLALVAVVPGETASLDGLRVVPLAYQVSVFGVAEGNPFRQASLPQLAALFGDKEAVDLRKWGQVVKEASWEGKAMSLHTVTAPSSLALDLFRSCALRAPQLKATVTQHPTTAAALARVRTDPTCLALLPGRPLGTPGIRLLLVSRGDDDVAFGPTPENIHAGDYPLRLPFSLVFPPERTGELRPVLQFLLGEAVAEALAAADFVPAPANARRQVLRDLERQ